MISRILLKSKIQNARVTHREKYEIEEGEEDALWLGRSLMKKAELWPFERVEIYNKTNGARLSTTVRLLAGESEKILITGAASLLIRPEDLIDISSFVQLSDQDLVHYSPKRIDLNC